MHLFSPENDVDINAITSVCKRFHYAIHSHQYWWGRSERKLIIPTREVMNVYQLYTSLIRSSTNEEDIPRFYSAFMRFFRDGEPDKIKAISKRKHRQRRNMRCWGPSRQNDIWIYSRTSNMFNLRLFWLIIDKIGISDSGLAFMRISWEPRGYLYSKTGNRLYIWYDNPPGDFAGSVFECHDDYVGHQYKPLQGFTGNDILDYFSAPRSY